MRKKIRWPLVVSLLAILVPALLAVGFYALVNRSGAREWEAVCTRMEAAGETFEMAELLRPAVPEAENFCAIPILREISLEGSLVGGENRARLEAVSLEPEGAATMAKPKDLVGADWTKRMDLKAWADYLREAEILKLRDDLPPELAILEGLEAAYGDVFEELAAGLDRPRAQLVPTMKETMAGTSDPFMVVVPHLNTMMTVVKTLRLRAHAAAAAGDAKVLRESLGIHFRFCEAARYDGFLIGQLVGIAQQRMFMSVYWEALDRKVFGEDDLEWLQKELGKIDWAESALQSMRIEIGVFLKAIEHYRDGGGLAGLSTLTGTGSGAGKAGYLWPWWENWASLIPEGWWDMNMATYLTWLWDYNIEPMKAGGFAAVRERETDFENAIKAASERKFRNALVLMAIPTYATLTRRFSYATDQLKRAETAVALERYFLERGAYPRSLEDLVPDYLEKVPLDLVDGEPLRYLRYVEGGRCRIWSVGWDGEDDGGKRELDPVKPEGTKFDDEKYGGDWVWEYTR